MELMPQQGGVQANCEVGTAPTNITPYLLADQVYTALALPLPKHLKKINQKEINSLELVCI
jgi:hypothetical protein